MKFEKTTYSNNTEILKFANHHVAMPVTVDDTGVANVNGKKVVPAGTIVGGGVLDDATKKVKKATDTADSTDAEGVLLYDVDVTHGPAPGALVIHGFIDQSKIPTAPTAIQKQTLNQITFIV